MAHNGNPSRALVPDAELGKLQDIPYALEAEQKDSRLLYG
jgi:hypothetical protein